MTLLNQAHSFIPLAATALLLLASSSASALTSNNEVIPDAAAIVVLEQHAAVAAPREQCFLYSELLHNLTELAGQQMAKGDDEGAASTFQHIDEVAAKVERVSARDAKRLKAAELILEHISHRVADMAKVASGEERTLVQTTLRHLETVHTGLLSLVFSR